MSWLYQPLAPAAAQQQASGGPTYTLTAGAGSFTLSGQAAGLLASRVLGAAAGAFALSGQAAGLTRLFTLTAEAGSFALSGQAAGLTASRVLGAEAGGFVLGGQAAGLLASRLLTADPGGFTLSGSAAGLQTTGALAADPGGFALAGQTAGLLVSRRLTADLGAFALTGQAAGLSAAGGALAADPGGFALAGQTAGLLVSRILDAGAGAFSLSVGSADLRKICVEITAPTTPLAVQKGWLRAVQIALSAKGFPDVRVYDHVPHGTDFPFVVMDQHQWIMMDGSEMHGFDHSFYASVWSVYRGQKEVMEILDALWRGLHDQKLLLDNGAHVLCQVTDQRSDQDQDGVTYQGSMTCRIISHPLSEY